MRTDCYGVTNYWTKINLPSEHGMRAFPHDMITLLLSVIAVLKRQRLQWDLSAPKAMPIPAKTYRNWHKTFKPLQIFFSYESYSYVCQSPSGITVSATWDLISIATAGHGKATAAQLGTLRQTEDAGRADIYSFTPHSVLHSTEFLATSTKWTR